MMFLKDLHVSGSVSCREAVVRSDEGDDEYPQMEVRGQSPEPSNVPANLQTLKYSELNKMMLSVNSEHHLLNSSGECSSVTSINSDNSCQRVPIGRFS